MSTERKNKVEWFVEVISYDTGKPIKSIGPSFDERTAEKVERGIMMNMNHEDYYTRVVPRGKK